MILWLQFLFKKTEVRETWNEQAGEPPILAQGRAAFLDANCRMTEVHDIKIKFPHPFMPGYHHGISVSRTHHSFTTDSAALLNLMKGFCIQCHEIRPLVFQKIVVALARAGKEV